MKEHKLKVLGIDFSKWEQFRCQSINIKIFSIPIAITKVNSIYKKGLLLFQK